MRVDGQCAEGESHEGQSESPHVTRIAVLPPVYPLRGHEGHSAKREGERGDWREGREGMGGNGKGKGERSGEGRLKIEVARRVKKWRNK